MPNGCTAPGYVLPALDVPISGLTYDTGSLTVPCGEAAAAGPTVAAIPSVAMAVTATELIARSPVCVRRLCVSDTVPALHV